MVAAILGVAVLWLNSPAGLEPEATADGRPAFWSAHVCTDTYLYDRHRVRREPVLAGEVVRVGSPANNEGDATYVAVEGGAWWRPDTKRWIPVDTLSGSAESRRPDCRDRYAVKTDYYEFRRTCMATLVTALDGTVVLLPAGAGLRVEPSTLRAPVLVMTDGGLAIPIDVLCDR
jgi:hypothetical protein